MGQEVGKIMAEASDFFYELNEAVLNWEVNKAKEVVFDQTLQDEIAKKSPAERIALLQMRDETGGNLLTNAAEKGNTKMINALLAGLPPEQIDRMLNDNLNLDGYSPLEMAIKNGKADTVQQLVRLGADTSGLTEERLAELYQNLPEDVAKNIELAMAEGEKQYIADNKAISPDIAGDPVAQTESVVQSDTVSFVEDDELENTDEVSVEEETAKPVASLGAAEINQKAADLVGALKFENAGEAVSQSLEGLNSMQQMAVLSAKGPDNLTFLQIAAMTGKKEALFAALDKLSPEDQRDLIESQDLIAQMDGRNPEIAAELQKRSAPQADAPEASKEQTVATAEIDEPAAQRENASSKLPGREKPATRGPNAKARQTEEVAAAEPVVPSPAAPARRTPEDGVLTPQARSVFDQMAGAMQRGTEQDLTAASVVFNSLDDKQKQALLTQTINGKTLVQIANETGQQDFIRGFAMSLQNPQKDDILAQLKDKESPATSKDPAEPQLAEAKRSARTDTPDDESTQAPLQKHGRAANDYWKNKRESDEAAKANTPAPTQQNAEQPAFAEELTRSIMSKEFGRAKEIIAGLKDKNLPVDTEELSKALAFAVKNGQKELADDIMALDKDDARKAKILEKAVLFSIQGDDKEAAYKLFAYAKENKQPMSDGFLGASLSNAAHENSNPQLAKEILAFAKENKLPIKPEHLGLALNSASHNNNTDLAKDILAFAKDTKQSIDPFNLGYALMRAMDKGNNELVDSIYASANNDNEKSLILGAALTGSVSLHKPDTTKKILAYAKDHGITIHPNDLKLAANQMGPNAPQELKDAIAASAPVPPAPQAGAPAQAPGGAANPAAPAAPQAGAPARPAAPAPAAPAAPDMSGLTDEEKRIAALKGDDRVAALTKQPLPLNHARAEDRPASIAALLHGLTDEQKSKVLSTRDDTGNTVLDYATAGDGPKNEATLKACLDSIKDKKIILQLIKQKDPNDAGQNLLHTAVAHGQTNKIKYLLEKVDEKDLPELLAEKDKQGFKALELAVKNGNKEAFDLLLKAGANPFDTENGKPLESLVVADREGAAIMLSSISEARKKYILDHPEEAYKQLTAKNADGTFKFASKEAFTKFFDEYGYDDAAKERLFAYKHAEGKGLAAFAQAPENKVWAEAFAGAGYSVQTMSSFAARYSANSEMGSFAVGPGAGDQGPSKDDIEKAKDAGNALAALDTDKDGLVSFKLKGDKQFEFEGGMKTTAQGGVGTLLNRLDTDDDGKVSDNELKAALIASGLKVEAVGGLDNAVAGLRKAIQNSGGNLNSGVATTHVEPFVPNVGGTSVASRGEGRGN